LHGEVIELVASRLRVVADPTRIRLLAMLNEHDATVTELSDRLLTTHQNVSHHLGVLHQAGLLSRSKEGNAVRYALIDWSDWWLIEQIAGAVAERIEDLHALLEAGPAPKDRA
jgi:DNA-binding transcriptional ArsR family regulator